MAFITIDERTAVEKKSISQILVAASDFKGALDNFLEGMKGTMADYEIVSINETPLVDVYKVKLDGQPVLNPKTDQRHVAHPGNDNPAAQ